MRPAKCPFHAARSSAAKLCDIIPPILFWEITSFWKHPCGHRGNCGKKIRRPYCCILWHFGKKTHLYLIAALAILKTSFPIKFFRWATGGIVFQYKALPRCVGNRASSPDPKLHWEMLLQVGGLWRTCRKTGEERRGKERRGGKMRGGKGGRWEQGEQRQGGERRWEERRGDEREKKGFFQAVSLASGAAQMWLWKLGFPASLKSTATAPHGEKPKQICKKREKCFQCLNYLHAVICGA